MLDKHLAVESRQWINVLTSLPPTNKRKILILNLNRGRYTSMVYFLKCDAMDLHASITGIRYGGQKNNGNQSLFCHLIYNKIH